MAGVLWLFWFMRGYSLEGWRWWRSYLLAVPRQQGRSPQRAGYVALFQGNSEPGEDTT
jgi:hypothetical protein